MVEKYFKIKEDYRIYKEYFDWLNKIKNRLNKWKQFKNLVGIESDAFVPRKELYIIPTENDIEKFGKYFCKEEFNGGLRKFKGNSLIQKDWLNFTSNNDMICSKPTVAFDFFKYALFSTEVTSRLFSHDKELYCSVGIKNINDFPTPEGYIEIKASEFFKILEKEKENNE